MANNYEARIVRKKAEENSKCAKLAEDAKLYNSAISRMYYACLLRAKHYIFINTKENDSTFMKADSHTLISSCFQSTAMNNPEYSNHVNDLNLNTLKAIRVDAEYNAQNDYCRCDKADDYEYFKTLVENFLKAIDTLN